MAKVFCGDGTPAGSPCGEPRVPTLEMKLKAARARFHRLHRRRIALELDSYVPTSLVEAEAKAFESMHALARLVRNQKDRKVGK